LKEADVIKTIISVKRHAALTTTWQGVKLAPPWMS
jgi:hypothetical protein